MLDIPLNVFPVPACRGRTHVFPCRKPRPRRNRNLWLGHTAMEGICCKQSHSSANQISFWCNTGSSAIMNYSASHFSWIFAYNLTHLCIISFLNKIKVNKIGFLCKNRRDNRITPTAELKPEMETVNKTGPERIEKKTPLFSLCSCTKLITRCIYIFTWNPTKQNTYCKFSTFN